MGTLTWHSPRPKWPWFFFFLGLSFFLGLFFLPTTGLSQAAPIFQVNSPRQISRPDPKFTQGLFFYNDSLFESSGLYGESELNQWELQTDTLKFNRHLKFSPQFFAEGAVLAQGYIWVLTWKENAVFKIDPHSFAIVDILFSKGQGWGLTFDGTRLIRSDGSDTLFFHDPITFEPLGEQKVRDGNTPRAQLNELEWDSAQNLLLANIYETTRACAIDPLTGKIQFYLDFTSLSQGMPRLSPQLPPILNGLALDSSGALWATGKMWPTLFQINYSVNF
ncbi:MAG: glutaminyl-peptide cyclotransferase [Deltaproteobacteria bacterium]|nr:glutaminyl-peptide cyclotransferase [Deltaproteobacteria bacterium]